MPLIKVNNLVRYYGHYCAVNNISFELAAGDILGFLGPNGAGKSTTMQMLSGNLAPSEGEIFISNIDILDQPQKAKANLGYLPEAPPLYREMDVDDYLFYCARLHRIEKNKIKDAVELARQRCGLADSGRRLIGNLSKGYQQRVGIAQAIVHSPDVIILDEPTVGLDPIQIREIRALIAELGKEHGIILSTHILPEVQAICNRVQIINDGKLVFESNIRDLINQEQSDSFDVSLSRPPSLESLKAVDFVDNAEQLSDNEFIIYTGQHNAEQITRAAVENNWGLYRLNARQRSLEQIFVELTLTEQSNEAA